MLVLDVQQKAIYDIITESNITSKEAYNAEVIRVKADQDSFPHSVLNLYVDKTIDDKGEVIPKLGDKLGHLVASNGVDLAASIGSLVKNSELMLSYLYIYKNIHFYYHGLEVKSPLSFAYLSEPLTDVAFFSALGNRFEELIKERFKISASVSVTRTELHVSYTALGTTHNKTFKVFIDKRFINDTYVECIFCHISYQMLYAIEQGTITISNDKIRHFVKELVTIYANAYK